MTTFLEGKPGGFEPISKIAKIPDLVENKIIQMRCRGCYDPVSIKESEAYSGDILCGDCETAHKKEIELKKRNRDINRLGGLKAYNQFTLAKYTNKPAIESCSVFPTVNLFLWGTAGTGKTHLATAIIREHDGVVIKPQRIYRDCRGIKDGEEEQAAIDRFINIPFMVLDDLGVDRKTDFSFSTLYEVIDGRDMSEMKGLIVTSNLSLTALAERLGDDRISSRLAGMCKVIEITGKDMRTISQ
mgnify:FL=1